MRDFIFKRIAAIIVPFICIYGFYVILHGGSFPGGIILGLAFIVFSTIYGVGKGKKKIPEKVLVWVESYGTLWYGLIGLIGIIKGAPFLSNKLTGISLGSPGSLASGGLISLLGLGVGIRVASTIITLFFTMKGEES
ncbi:MAG: MnhB domain-containing protein [Tissierella sp.]|uniref:MnhB domain-containing protein n=1 Tax=Tissierella sp. TaxID=41274 RepID=UPI003F9E59D3